MTEPYEEYLKSVEWRERALEAKRRAGYECALCASSNSLEVHHRTYDRIGRERPCDLVVLCWRCHRRHHGTLEQAQALAKQRRYQQLLPFTHQFPHDEELN